MLQHQACGCFCVVTRTVQAWHDGWPFACGPEVIPGGVGRSCYEEPTDEEEYDIEAQLAMEAAEAASAAASAAATAGQGSAGDSSDGDSGPAAATETAPESDLDSEDGSEKEVQAADKQALREIRHYQRTVHKLLSRPAFADLAEELLEASGADGFCFEPEALEVLQTGAESFLVDTLKSANLMAVHRSSQKLTAKDLLLVAYCSDNLRKYFNMCVDKRKRLT